MLGQLGHVFVSFADNIMVGRLGAAPLAAVSLANSIFFVAMSLGIGFTFAITPLIAEADGAKNDKDGRDVLDHGLLMSLVLGITLFSVMLLLRPILYHMDQPGEVVKLAIPYFNIISFSLVPLLLFQGLKQFADGLSMTKYAMQATILANVVNVALNYILIYGFWIFPRLEIIGAGIGTLISRIIMVIFLMLIFRRQKVFQPFLRKFSFSNIKKTVISKIFNLGYPTAFQFFFEVSIFTAAVLMAGRLGTNEQAANQIALNLASMTFMIAVGLGVAATVRVGNQKGLKNHVDLRRIAFSIFLLMIIIDLCFAFVFFLAKDLLPWIYIDNAEVVAIASTLIAVAGFFQVSDGFQAVVLGGLRGIQDVKKPTWITFIAYWIIGFPACYLLGFYTPLGTTGIWIGLLISLTASAIMLFVRFNALTKSLVHENNSVLDIG